MAELRIRIRLRNVSLSETLRRYVEQALRTRLKDHAAEIETVHVRLTARGRVKTCALRVEGATGWLAVAERGALELEDAITAAARAVTPEVELQRATPRERVPATLPAGRPPAAPLVPSPSATAVGATLRWARKVAVAVIGLTVLAFGIVLLVLPGPALLVIPLGLAILATEFLWARRLLVLLRERANRLLHRPRRPASST